MMQPLNFLLYLITILKYTSLSSTTPPRVYVPRSSGLQTSNMNPPPTSSQTLNSKAPNPGPQTYIPFRPVGGGRGGGYKSNERIVSLQHPQLFVRFRAPKKISERKLELLGQQEAYKAAAEEIQNQRDESSSSYRDRQSGNEKSWNSKNTDSGNGGIFFDRFVPPPAFSELGRKGSTSKGRGSVKEVERKGSEGRRKDGEMRRSKSDDDDADYEDVESTTGDGGLSDEDYYGDEGNNLSSVPAAALRAMDIEGYTLQEMQTSLYGEWGVKVSASAIKRRLKDDANEKKSKKRSGKTRRDRQNVRNARLAERKNEGIKLPDATVIQVSQLAELMEIGAGEVVKHLMMNKGVMATMNQNIDINLAKEVVLAFGKKLAADADDADDDEDENVDEDDAEEEQSQEVVLDGVTYPRLPRPPVVTIMGHVDHGKTTLLDTIRKALVAQSEAGGITQAISAFKVGAKDDKFITFIDTPGHAAFREMRKRGANITDIVVLVVAADDGIMEQTKECIAAAKTAGCPIVVAINKIDKEAADIQNVLTSLTDYGLLVEDFGGEVQTARVSAKKAIGIDDLLDKLLLQAEIMELRAAVGCRAEGTVIEARMDRRLGVVASVLVQQGTLRVGDFVLAGHSWGRVRRLLSDQGEDLKEAGPSTPVQIVGMTVVPNAGDTLSVTSDEASAKDVAEARQRLARQAVGSVSTASIIATAAGFAQGTIDNRDVMKVPVVIKADVAGSVEALLSSLAALEASDEEAVCKVDVVYSGVGEVTSSDVAIAAVAKAKLIAFNVGSNFVAAEAARSSNVEVGYYDVVYTLLDEMQERIQTLLAPPPPGVLVGRAVIKKVFKIGKVGKVAGCEVTEGVIRMESKCRVMRGKRNPVYTGTLSSLKVVKENKAEVPLGSECGISFEKYQDFEEGDVIECFVGGDGEKEESAD